MEDTTMRVKYSDYKNNFRGCKAVSGSYDEKTKTIEIEIAELAVKLLDAGFKTSAGSIIVTDLNRVMDINSVNKQFLNLKVVGECPKIGNAIKNGAFDDPCAARDTFILCNYDLENNHFNMVYYEDDYPVCQHLMNKFAAECQKAILKKQLN